MIKKEEKRDGDLNKTAAVILHEIKNPVTALLFQIENLKAVLPKEFLPEVESMDCEIKRLAELVDCAGDFLTDSSGQPELFEFVPFIKKVVDSFPSGIKLSCICPDCVSVFFDRMRLKSVFENLIRNACESNNGEDAKVEVSVEAFESSVVVKVSDRGKGFEASLVNHLFDLGFTTKQRGTGLGLFLVKQFVEAGKGSVSLSCREGGGTTAEVTLPLRIKY